MADPDATIGDLDPKVPLAAPDVPATIPPNGSASTVPPPVAKSEAGDALPPPPSPVQSPSPAVPGYEILSELGRGGMGVVYRARDKDLERSLAIKVLLSHHAGKADYIQRFLEEARIMAQLQHPGVAPLHEIGTLPDGRPFFAMKQVKGRTLADILKQRPNLASDLPRLLAAFTQVCQTLAYAHERRIIHRDLKPDNIMVGAFGEVQVMDWGLAKVLTAEATEVQRGGPAFTTIHTPYSDLPQGEQTRAGSIMGTLAYMAPEQALGQVDLVDQCSDVFGLGAILCEILTGQPPYATGDSRQRHLQACRADQRAARELLQKCGADPELIEICQCCLAPEREQRPGQGGDLAETMVQYQARVQERLRAAEIARAAAQVKAAEERKRRRIRTALVAVGLAAVLLGVAGAAIASLWLKAETALDWQKDAEQSADEARRREQEAKQQADQAEAARKLALTEQAVGQAVDQGQKIRGELYAILKKPGGVQALLNQPAQWQAFLATANSEQQRAKAVAGTAEAALDPELKNRMQQLAQDLAGDEADNRLALQLEKIRVDTARVVESEFDKTQAEREYPLAFAGAGLTVEQGREAELAGRITRSPIKDLLLAALDHWALVVESKQPKLAALLTLARLADADPSRDKVRDPAVRKNTLAIEQLAAAAQNDAEFQSQLSPQILHVVSRLLQGSPAKAETWLRKSQALHPADFWINFELALRLCSNKDKVSEGIGFYRAALAIRPGSSTVYNNLGNALRQQKDLAGTVDAFNKALSIDPQFVNAWSNLGVARLDLKDTAGAVDAFNRALDIDPKHVNAWFNLALALRDQKDLPGAVDAYKKALDIDAKFTLAWNNLGLALRDQNDLPGAVDAFKNALASDPTYLNALNNLGNALLDLKDLPGAVDVYKKWIDQDGNDAQAHYGLGRALLDLGEFPQALKVLQRGQELDKQTPGPSYPFAKWVTECEKLLSLDKKLPEVLEGKAASAGEYLELADLCQRYKKRYGDAAALFEKAFAGQPQLAEDFSASYRYQAARASMLAAAGKSAGGDKLDDKEKVRLRRLGLDWLTAELTARGKVIAQDRLAVVKTQDDLQHWQNDPDLASVREAKELERLPAEEKTAWQKLWRDVHTLLQQVRGSYTQKQQQGKLSPKKLEQVHEQKLTAGAIYVFDLESPQFDAYLRLETSQGTVLAENDDISAANQNSRIVFTPQETVIYRIVATSLGQRGVGSYTLTIRELAESKK